MMTKEFKYGKTWKNWLSPLSLSLYTVHLKMKEK